MQVSLVPIRNTILPQVNTNPSELVKIPSTRRIVCLDCFMVVWLVGLLGSVGWLYV